MPHVEQSLITPSVIAELNPQLLHAARRMLRRNEDAEDVVQEMWISALRSAARYEGRSSLRAWLTGILRKRIYDRYKERQFDALLDEVRADAPHGPEQLDLR